MSPRSEEYLVGARDSLRAARTLLDAGHPRSAVSDAYYAMLYGARAALSEEGVQAKTHRGTWAEFRRVLVLSGGFDPELAAAASRAQGQRERSDYELEAVEPATAERILAEAEAFIAAIEARLGS